LHRTSGIYLINSILSNLSTSLHNLPLPTTTCNTYPLQTSLTTVAYKIEAHDKMHRLLLFLLLIAVSLGKIELKAVPYGQISSAETLFQSSTPSTTPESTLYNSLQHDEISEDFTPLDSIDNDFDEPFGPDIGSEATSGGSFNMDDHFHNKDGDNWGSYVPIEVNDKSTTVRRASGFGLEKRAFDAGVVQMDCLETPEVCKNAGWFQNCLRGAKGDHTKVTYENGPQESTKDHPVADANRLESGVLTHPTTPCRLWPLAQRFWHMHPNASQLVHEATAKLQTLQTDEWPMTIMKTNKLVFNSPIPEVSLRCMENGHNSRGAQQVLRFRRCQTVYSNKDPKKIGKWAGFRKGPCQPLALGDTYHVQFNFDRFVAGNPDHDRLRA
jgi:hypothetical protein